MSRTLALAAALIAAATIPPATALPQPAKPATPTVQGKGVKWWATRARENGDAMRWQKKRNHALERQLTRRLEPVQASAREAISYVFGPYAGQALRVAYCESRLSVYATNGQYLGLFQMGEFARSRYGHGWDPWAQAVSAWRYFVESGRDWSPWSCKP